MSGTADITPFSGSYAPAEVTFLLRCLQLEAHGYQVNVTELVGWEHSMKNELIVASQKDLPRERASRRLNSILETLGIEEMTQRFWCADAGTAGSAAGSN